MKSAADLRQTDNYCHLDEPVGEMWTGFPSPALKRASPWPECFMRMGAAPFPVLVSARVAGFQAHQQGRKEDWPGRIHKRPAA